MQRDDDREYAFSLVDQALALFTGNQSELARRLGTTQPSVNSWCQRVYAPSRGNVLALEKILGLQGGSVPLPTPSITVLGQVAAGAVTLQGEKIYTVELCAAAWKTSRLWTLTTGEVVFLEVDGESMSPEYQSGELLACRAPTDPKRLPDRTPCVFHEQGGGYTFKLLRRVGHGRTESMVAEPINSHHRLIHLSERMRIEYVVLGHINLGR